MQIIMNVTVEPHIRQRIYTYGWQSFRIFQNYKIKTLKTVKHKVWPSLPNESTFQSLSKL